MQIKIMQKAPTGAFCINFDLHKMTTVENCWFILTETMTGINYTGCMLIRIILYMGTNQVAQGEFSVSRNFHKGVLFRDKHYMASDHTTASQ